MKTIKTIFAFLTLSLLFSCNKDDNAPASTTLPANTLLYKGNPITFNGLSVDDAAPNRTSEYIFTTSSEVSIVLYCKYIDVVGTDPIQVSADGTVTYTADAVNYLPVNNYPELTVRGYLNDGWAQYFTTSGQVKIKRNDTGDQTFEFINFKVKAGNDEQVLNGIINLPKN